jgi:CHAT domain-containing protein/tetratricopeptide (TPR) repeat protein
MRARALLLAFLLIVPACTQSLSRFDSDYNDARQTMWRGELAEAQALADAGAKRGSAAANATWHWRFRLLSCEVAILRRDFVAAESILSAPLPDGQAYDTLRARQQLLAAYLQVEQGNPKAGHETLLKARALAPADSDISLEIDRLDGQALLRLREWDQGEALLNRALVTAVDRGNLYVQAIALNDLGMSRVVRSRYDEALTYFERVTAMQDASQWSIYALSSRNAGSCYQRLGQFDRAVALQEKALIIQERRGKREYFVQALGELGNLYALRGDPERALPYLRRGLAEAKSANVTTEIARLAGNLASVEIDLQRWDDAESHNQEAQRLWMLSHSEPSVYHLLNDALIAKGRRNFDDADKFLRKVLAVSEAPPSVLWDAHFDLAGVALARKQPNRAAAEFEAALKIVETTRAGLLRTDDKVSYLTRLISFYQGYVSALLAQGQTDRALEVADSSRGQLLAERQKTSSPGRVKAAAFQRVARESGAVILSYWLDPDRSWLWVLSPRGMKLLPLPPAKEIETLVRQHQATIADAMADPLAATHTAGDKLYQILVAPAAEWIPKDARVIIVPGGALHEINFETLTADSPLRHYWIDDVQIEIAPSLATLTSPAGSVASGSSRLLLVGNPRAHEPDFPALAHAAAEMSNIAAHFAPDAVTTLDGDRASPAAYTEAHPDQFAYVHFTAHATANLDSPLDSVVALSGPPDRFKLYARDVAALRLHADLVTISACRSAGDHAYSGDGLVGFSWAFLKAGARHVIAGLWDIDDGSTPRLMDHLYAGLASGQPPGRALRDAKRALIAAGGASAAPYRWAALELFTASP